MLARAIAERFTLMEYPLDTPLTAHATLMSVSTRVSSMWSKATHTIIVRILVVCLFQLFLLGEELYSCLVKRLSEKVKAIVVGTRSGFGVSGTSSREESWSRT